MYMYKRWSHRALGCLLAFMLCSKAPLHADCDYCDGGGDAYRHSRICQVTAGWVIGGVVVAAVAVAIFGKGCGHHHHCHQAKCHRGTGSGGSGCCSCK